jgi:hypothetical protein
LSIKSERTFIDECNVKKYSNPLKNKINFWKDSAAVERMSVFPKETEEKENTNSHPSMQGS